MSDLEIEALMNDASRTKDEMIQMIMQHHEAALLRYATRLVNDSNAAKDVVQNTFIKLYVGWDNGSRPDRHVKSWLYKVTHNNAVDLIRKEHRVRDLHERHAEELATMKDHEKSKCKREDAMKLALEHIELLKPNEKQVLLLRLQEGLSYREISEITNESEGNVGYLLHHAVKKLSKSLKLAGAL